MIFEEAKALRIEMDETGRNNKEDLLAYTGLTPGEAIAFLNRFQDPDEQFDDNVTYGSRTFQALDAFLVGAFAAVSYARLQARQMKAKGGVA